MFMDCASLSFSPCFCISADRSDTPLICCPSLLDLPDLLQNSPCRMAFLDEAQKQPSLYNKNNVRELFYWIGMLLFSLLEWHIYRRFSV